MEIGILLVVHLLSALVWVGGMFFAYVVLRPSMGAVAQPIERLQLWSVVFQRFFRWVWLAVVLLLASGYGMIFLYGGMGAVGSYVHIMNLIGLVMMALFGHLYFAPFRRFKAAVAQGDTEGGAKYLNSIRRIVAINLTLGMITTIIGSGGRYFG